MIPKVIGAPPVHHSTIFKSLETYPSRTRLPNARSGAIIVTGRIDHAIGRVLRPSHNHAKRSFQSLLLVMAPREAGNLHGVVAQLVVYMASFHQSRVLRGRSDASVYGLASAGYTVQFVRIKHDSTVERSRTFDVQVPEDIKMVLGCLKYVLELSESQLSGLAPEKKVDVDSDIGDDPVIDLHDNSV